MSLTPTPQNPQFALLIGSPHHNDIAMHNDLVVMYNSLLQRGLTPPNIWSLEGALNRSMLLNFLSEASKRIASWTEGDLFLYASGHGFFRGDTVEDARVGLLLQPTQEETDDYHVLWDDIFNVLSPPPNVALTLLPDH